MVKIGICIGFNKICMKCEYCSGISSLGLPIVELSFCYNAFCGISLCFSFRPTGSLGVILESENGLKYVVLRISFNIFTFNVCELILLLYVY